MQNVQFRGHELEIEFGFYEDGSIAIRLYNEEGPFATASVWVEGLIPGEIAIKNYSENAGMLDSLIEAGVIQEPHRWVHQGFVSIPVTRMTQEAVKALEESL